jgi:hypothetical protein
MYLALKVLAFTRDVLVISASIALAAFVTLLPFMIIMAMFPVGHPGAVILMVGWFICLIVGLGYYVCDY